jgi:hypothetical protein
MLVALPLALVLGNRLEAALVTQPPIDLNAEEIDADWWREYRAHGQGLSATFTPAIVGFAAPLDHLSAMLDGRAPGWTLAVPVAAYGVMWALLWGGVLHRFTRARAMRLREVWSACLRHFPAFLAVSALAAATVAVLYLTVHRWLFGAVYAWILTVVTTEAGALSARIVLYVIFGALLAYVGLCADYTRVSLLAGGGASLGEAWRIVAKLFRRHAGTVLALFVVNATVFVVLLAAYGVLDERFRGWRGVLLAQAFVVARVVLRLVNAASQVELFRRTQ